MSDVPGIPELQGLPVHLHAWVKPATGFGGQSTSVSFILR